MHGSSLDAVVGRVPVLTVYLYEKSRLTSCFMDIKILKDSLSRLLVYYFPFAGRGLDCPCCRMVSFSCTDEGIDFEVCKSELTIASIREKSKTKSHYEAAFVPPELVNVNGMAMAIKVTYLACGGCAIGVTIHHCFVDGDGFFYFMNCWAAMARGAPFVPPMFDRSRFIGDAKNAPDHFPGFIPPFIHTDCVIKPFTMHLSASQLDQLKKKVGTPPDGKWLSTNDIISAKLWRTLVRAQNLAPEAESRFSIPTNGRERFRPPLPPSFCGNVVLTAVVTAQVKELLNESLVETAARIRQAINLITAEYYQTAMDFLAKIPDKQGISLAVNTKSHIVFTTWHKFPMYDCDFGWGRPVYVGPPCFKDTAGFFIGMNNPAQDGGMDLVACVNPEDRRMLEHDEDLNSTGSI